MKFNFKKISAIASSALMVGMSMGVAAAANYPAPFVSGTSADVAIVYGTGEGVSSLDLVSAGNIQSNLQSKVETTPGTSSTVVGGDSVALEKSTNKFNIGESISDFYSTLDNEELSTVLAKGVYSNDANDEFDYEQKISLFSINLSHFLETDNEFSSADVPVIGFDMVSGQYVLNYTLTFTPNNAEAGGNWASGNDLETTDLTMLGRTYYVLSARNTTATNHKLTLLDTANSALITDGETKTITIGDKTYEVSIDFIDATNVILNVNGAQTNKLAEGGVYKIATDTYIAVKSNLYDAKESGISKAEISIGSGKIEIQNLVEVKVNGDEISDIEGSRSKLNGYISVDSSNNLNKVTLQWILDDDNWLIKGEDLVLPGFETIKFSMGDFVSPKQEITTVTDNGVNSARVKTTIKDGDVTLDLLALNGSVSGFNGLGEKSNHKLVTNASTNTINLLLNETEQSYFVATWINGQSFESYAFEIKGITEATGKNSTTLNNLASSGSDIIFSEVGDEKSAGEVTMTLSSANDNGKWARITLTKTSGTLYANRVVTKEGMMFRLPVDSPDGTGGDGYINITNSSTHIATWAMNFTEEDKDGNIGLGKSFTVTIVPDSTNNGAEPSTLTGITTSETEDGSKKYEGYMTGPLATKVLHDRPTSGLNNLDITYAGEESYASVFISESAATVVSGEVATLGDIVVKDSEVSSVSTKNLVIVGGSCINSAAAAVIGGAYCGSSFTDATNIGTGQYLIKGYTGTSVTSKLALVVAGYEAADTTAAASYLTTQSVDTSKAYKGTSSTSAEVITTETA